jgi:ankyrin repeat protein
MNSIVKMLIFAFIITSLIACKNDSQLTSKELQLSNQKHTELVLETKRAILNLDFFLVDKLSSKIDVNRALADNSSLLAWAVETQDPRLVHLMLEKGAKAQVENGNRFTPIIQACRYGNAEIINALLEQEADPNSAIEDGTSAFQLCAGSASTENLTRMVSLGANITAKNNNGQTALMRSANFGKVENMNYLISLGASVNHQTLEGYSALFFSIKSQKLSAVKAAISHGADLFATAQDGTTAAQLGVYTMNYEFLTWFASALNSLMSPEAIKKVLTAFDRDGYQLLHAAVNANQPQLVSKLLELGANSMTVSEPSTLKWRYEANFKTENYYPPQLTPIELAEQSDFKNIASILRR